MGARRYEVSRSIDAPVATVWALLSDTGTYPEWNKTVLSIEGTIQQGNTIKLVSIVDPGRTFKLKVSELQAPTRMVWSDGMPLGLFTGRRTYVLSSIGPDRTKFTMSEEFSGLLATLVAKAIPDLTDSFNVFADGLKIAAEDPQAP